jgi:enoyl-CoA hydratase/carnithine racemase
MAYEDISVEVDDHVATITIDRPPRNSFVPTTMIEIRDAVARADDDHDVRCIVITAAGKYFATGADLSRPGYLDRTTGRVDRTLIKQEKASAKKSHGYLDRPILATRTPVIAAINGAAVGAGLCLALQADIRIVVETAKLSMAFTKRGLVPEMGVTWLLPRLIGSAKAADLLLTGREFRGLEAVSLGLASEAVPFDDIYKRARELAGQISRECSPLAVSITKRMLWAFAAESSMLNAIRTEYVSNEWVTQHLDVAEGTLSFLEKRSPEWRTSTGDPVPSFIPDIFPGLPEDYV